MRQYWIMYLLRGLGISELPKIFTTQSEKIFITQFYTPQSMKSSKNAKKDEILKY